MAIGSLLTWLTFVWWANHIYTVGIDINLKAVIVAVLGVPLIIAAGLALRRVVRRRKT